MNELHRINNSLLDSDVSAELISEFNRIYAELMLATASNMDEVDDDTENVLNVIDMIGYDDDQSAKVRRYLYYLYGKFRATDLYAEAMGELSPALSDSEREVLDTLMDIAINKINK